MSSLLYRTVPPALLVPRRPIVRRYIWEASRSLTPDGRGQGFTGATTRQGRMFPTRSVRYSSCVRPCCIVKA